MAGAMIGSMRVVVTGVLDSIGSALVEHLSALGHELRVICARDQSAPFQSRSGIEVLEADLSIPGGWQQELDGAALVIHLVDPPPVGEQEGGSDSRDAGVRSQLDSIFQVVWAIERARNPPQGIVIQSAAGVSGETSSGAGSFSYALERLTEPLRRLGCSILISRTPDPEGALATLKASAKIILSSSPSDGEPDRPEASSSTVGSAHRAPACPLPALVISIDEYLLESRGASFSMKQLLQGLSDHGVPLVYTTTRSAVDALSVADEFGVGDLVIAGDGSALLDLSSREVVRTELLTAEQVMGICLAVRTGDSAIGIQIERGRHASCNLPRSVPGRLRWLFGEPMPVPFTELIRRPATRVLLHGVPRRLAHSVADLRETWEAQKLVKIVEYDRCCLGVLGPTADRIVALQHAESILGLPRFSSLVFVGQRDGELLHGWKHSCALAGMGRELSSRASFIIPSAGADETCEHLIEALRAIQPSIPTH
ncbi:MAG: HAD hydrolase family protein [Planctomycetota bacterium]|nr:HAD hydrolase family protein [Planctomycetota bacterium]